MRTLAKAPLLAVVASLSTTPARAADTITAPFSGGTLVHTVTGTQDLWVLKVDLCAAGVSVRTTADGERGRTVPSFSNLVGAQAAINGDFFGGGFGTDGPAAHGGTFWSSNNHTYVAPVSFGPGHVDVPHHNNEGPTPAWAREVVSGHPTLLDDGQVVGNPGDPLCTNRHPRTAIGISQDHRTLVLAVVDGRRAGAAGMTCDELSFVMAAHGAFDAVNMDGGGSSTMVVNGGTLNRPSDGQPRTVGNHLAILASGAGPSPQCPGFVDPACDGDANLERCTGTVAMSCEAGAPVLDGDCGFFGAGCSTGGGTAHCVHPFCLANLDGGETGAFCLDGTRIGTCDLGVFGEGDCGAFGATCSEQGGAGHCVHFLCHTNLDGGEDGSFCRGDTGALGTCALGVYAEQSCGAGTACVESSGTRAACVDPDAPPPPPDDEPDPPPPGGDDDGPVDEPGGAAGDDDAPRAGRLPPSTEAVCGAGPAAAPLAAILLITAGLRPPRRRRRS